MSPSQLTIPPSAVFIYSPRSIDDDLKEPLSPTSSLKGVFVRSRPTSTAFSDYEYTEFAGLGLGGPSPFSTDEESGASTPTTDDVLAATDHWAHAQTHTQTQAQAQAPPADACSLAPSTYTTTSRMRIVRRSNADMHAEELKLAREEADAPAEEGKEKGEKDKDKEKTRRRTWPSYKAIRKTVSNILHRKDSLSYPNKDKDGDIPAQPRVAIDAPLERVKPSSVSLFSRRRTRRRATTTTTTTDPKASKRMGSTNPVAAALAYQPQSQSEYRAQLRRSRSFSGFTNVLSAIHDDELDEDLDEATAEARQLVVEIRRRWAFEDVPEDEGDGDRDGYLFERAVERRG